MAWDLALRPSTDPKNFPTHFSFEAVVGGWFRTPSPCPEPPPHPCTALGIPSSLRSTVVSSNARTQHRHTYTQRPHTHTQTHTHSCPPTHTCVPNVYNGIGHKPIEATVNWPGVPIHPCNPLAAATAPLNPQAACTAVRHPAPTRRKSWTGTPDPRHPGRVRVGKVANGCPVSVLMRPSLRSSSNIGPECPLA